MSHTRRAVGTVALLVTIVLGTALATVPTPLYPVYAAELGLDSLGVTATFAAFAGGAVVGLGLAVVFAGRLPRRRAYLIAAVLQCAAALLLSVDLGVTLFAIGRVVTGLGAGLLAASGTAFILELADTLPARSGRALRVVAPAFAFLGLGTGSALAGIVGPSTIAQVHALFLVIAIAIAITASLSLVLLPRSAGRMLPPPAAATARIPWASALGAFAAFMTTGLFGSVTTLLLGLLGIVSAPVAGAFAASVFVAGAIGVAVLAPRVTLPVAAWLLAAGAIAVAAGTTLRLSVVLLAGAAIAGCAGGALFARSLRAAIAVAPSAAFRQTALVFACAYLGLAVPVLGLGLALRVVPTEPAIWTFGAAAALVCAGAAVSDAVVARRASRTAE